MLSCELKKASFWSKTYFHFLNFKMFSQIVFGDTFYITTLTTIIMYIFGPYDLMGLRCIPYYYKWWWNKMLVWRCSKWVSCILYGLTFDIEILALEGIDGNQTNNSTRNKIIGQMTRPFILQAMHRFIQPTSLIQSFMLLYHHCYDQS